MAQELTTIDPADGRPDQAQRALSLLPSTTDRLAAALGEDAPGCIDAAIAKLEHDLRPVPTSAEERKQWAGAIDERLRRLAVKVLPTAAPAQTQPWREAMAAAFSDLPAMVSLTAAKRAIHRPFRFIGDIEAEVRTIADELMAERTARLAMLRRMHGELERATSGQPALPAPELPMPTRDQLARTNAFLRARGLTTQLHEDGSTYQLEPLPVDQAA